MSKYNGEDSVNNTLSQYKLQAILDTVAKMATTAYDSEQRKAVAQLW